MNAQTQYVEPVQTISLPVLSYRRGRHGPLQDFTQSHHGVSVNRLPSFRAALRSSDHSLTPARRRTRLVLLVVVASICLSSIVRSQQPTARDTAYLDSVFRAHHFTVTIDDGRSKCEARGWRCGSRAILEPAERRRWRENPDSASVWRCNHRSPRLECALHRPSSPTR